MTESLFHLERGGASHFNTLNLGIVVRNLETISPEPTHLIRSQTKDGGGVANIFSFAYKKQAQIAKSFANSFMKV